MSKVLLLEDSAVFVRMMRQLLREHELVVIDSPHKVKAALSGTKFDLVIADYVFGDGDCSRLLMWIRSKYTPKQLPVIIVSCSVDNDMRTRYYNLGINACYAKPVNNITFPEVVRQIILTGEVYKPQKQSNTAALINWKTVEGFYVYSPATGRREFALTLEEAQAKMITYLENHKTVIPTISSIKETICKF